MMLRTMSNRGGNVWLPRYASMAQGATIPQLFTAAGAGVPGLCYRFADSRFNSSARNGSTGFGATSGPLGLVLDQARGALDALGPELWNHAGVTVAGTESQILGPQSYRIYSSTGANSLVTIVGVLTVGKTYEALLTINSIAAAGSGIRLGDFTSSIFTSTGPQSARFVADSANMVIKRVALTGATDYQISNISVREIPGTHALALSDAARPNIETFPGSTALCARLDGIDDALQSVAPITWGTDRATVIAVLRATANGSEQVVAELSANWSANAGTWTLLRTAGNAYTFGSRGSSGSAQATTGAFGQPDNAILIGRVRIGTPIAGIRKNSGAPVTDGATQGPGNLGAHLLNIACRNAASPSARFSGQLAALCAVGIDEPDLPPGWVETMTGLLVPPGAVFS